MNNLFSNLSDYWRQGHLDAVFFNPKTKLIYFFKGDQYVRLPYNKSKEQSAENPKIISELVVNWPFKWGTGDIDAALFNERTNEVLLYRGQEQLLLKFNGEDLIILNEMPQKINLEWPTNLWGNRN